MDALEEIYRQRGGFNHLVARYGGNACRLLGFADEERRFQRLLSKLTPELYWAGAITNLDTTKLPESAKQLSPLEKIEQQYPVFPPDYADSILRRMGGHLSLCADRDYEQASAQADSELARVEVILAQVLMGDFELAAESLPHLSEDHRRRNVLMAITTELYRSSRTSEAEKYRRKLPPESLCDWDGVYIAVGASNRVPWPIYPFPDY